MDTATIYFDIRQELELIRRELRARLAQEQHQMYFMETSVELFGPVLTEEEAKRRTVLQHIQEDLKDVELALCKMDNGTYGVCEETGQTLSLRQLHIMPTARTMNELLYQRLQSV
ncbi:TraR/DksA family transcriptional regulator [Ectobacillus ponti]|uniref:Molecular chaperone DnaK n=1 Tax=Ectobacillus ponti TaxID=2961894 RepID=A0AA42BRA9_9BACI|nr:molecular chaperone DnaK [Ectobacillus ponti]MCP8970226.1 molecular chaperone DnaK [Ectobacillus ponti]